MYDVACSNIAKYDYMMLLKYYFLYKASELEVLKDFKNIAWVDFGFNHGDAYYLSQLDFNFTWEWSFTKDIELFALSNPVDMPLIDSLQFQKDCIQGSVVGCKRERAKDLWRWIREDMVALLRNESMDDDQHLLLMMYKEHANICHVTICDWFQSIEITSKRKFLTREKKVFRNNYKKQIDDWMQRCHQRVKSYYWEVE